MKLGKLECENCDLHEKHVEDYHWLPEVELCEISFGGGRHMKIFDGWDDCVNFTKHITAATEVKSLYCKEKEH